MNYARGYSGIVEWDRLFGFIRSRYPKLTKYGNDEGGDTRKVLAVLNDHELLDIIAHGLFKIDCAYEAETASLYQKIEKAMKDRNAALKKLAEELP